MKDGIYSKASDIFSLGMTFYEIASLDIPLQAHDDWSAMMMISQDSRDAIPSYLPENLQMLITQMWSTYYPERYVARQVSEALKKILDRPTITPAVLEEELEVSGKDRFEDLSTKEYEV